MIGNLLSLFLFLHLVSYVWYRSCITSTASLLIFTVISCMDVLDDLKFIDFNYKYALGSRYAKYETSLSSLAM